MTLNYKFSEKDGWHTFGGVLDITANEPASIQALHHLEHFHPTLEQTQELLKAMQEGLYEIKKGSEKRPCFEISGALELEFTQPYFDAMAKYLGYEGRGILPDIQLTGFDPLCATRILREAILDNGHFCYVCYVTAEPWNGKEAHEYAEQIATRYMKKELGFEPTPREFIENNNGTYRKNPEYGRTQKIVPGLHSEWLWRDLVSWWMKNEATPEQVELIEQDRELHQKLFPGLTELGKKASGAIDLQYNRGPDYGGLRRDWEGPAVSWEEFKQLGKAAKA